MLDSTSEARTIISETSAFEAYDERLRALRASLVGMGLLRVSSSRVVM